MRKKILFSLPNLNTAGAQRQTVAIANGLCGEFDCVVFALGGGGIEGEIASGVKLLTPCYPAFVKRFHFLSRLWGSCAFFRAVIREKPDVLYSRHWTKILNTVAGRIFGIKTVWTEGNNIGFLRERNWLMFFLHRFFAQRADSFTAISEGLAGECVEVYGGVVPQVIHNGVDTALAREKSKQRVNMETGAGIPVVVSVGRFVRQKGFDTLIDAFSLVKKSMAEKGGDARLLLVGDGKLRGSLEERARGMGIDDAIIFAGEMVNPYPLIALADVYVQPSVYEGFGNTLLEAQCLGVPCISTDYKFAASEIIRDGENGLLVPVGDAEKMAEAILKMIENPVLANVMAKSGATRAESFFSIEKMTGKYAELFRKVAD